MYILVWLRETHRDTTACRHAYTQQTYTYTYKHHVECQTGLDQSDRLVDERRR